MISERLPDRPRQLPHASDAVPPTEDQGSVVRHRHSRMNVKAASVTQLCLSLNSLPRPQNCQGTSKTDCGGGRWVAAQKPPQQHLAGETSLLGGDPESNRSCPGPREHQERWPQSAGHTVKLALSISSRAKVQSQPRSGPRRGNGHSRAQWETFKKWCGLGTRTKISAASPKINTVLTSTPSPSGWDLGGLAAMECEVADASPPTAEVLFPSRTVRMNTHCCNVEKKSILPTTCVRI